MSDGAVEPILAAGQDRPDAVRGDDVSRPTGGSASGGERGRADRVTFEDEPLPAAATPTDEKPTDAEPTDEEPRDGEPEGELPAEVPAELPAFDVAQWMAESDAQAALAASEAAAGAARAASLAAEAALTAAHAAEAAAAIADSAAPERLSRLEERVDSTMASVERSSANLDAQVSAALDAANKWFVRTRNDLYERIDRITVALVRGAAGGGTPGAPGAPGADWAPSDEGGVVFAPLAVAAVSIDADAMAEVLEPLRRDVEELQGEVAAMGRTLLRMGRDLQELRKRPPPAAARLDAAQFEELVQAVRSAATPPPRPRPPDGDAAPPPRPGPRPTQPSLRPPVRPARPQAPPRPAMRPAGSLSEEFGQLAQLMDDPREARDARSRAAARPPLRRTPPPSLPPPVRPSGEARGPAGGSGTAPRPEAVDDGGRRPLIRAKRAGSKRESARKARRDAPDGASADTGGDGRASPPRRRRPPDA